MTITKDSVGPVLAGWCKSFYEMTELMACTYRTADGLVKAIQRDQEKCGEPVDDDDVIMEMLERVLQKKESEGGIAPVST